MSKNANFAGHLNLTYKSFHSGKEEKDIFNNRSGVP